MVMDEATIKQLAGQMSQAMAQYEQMLKNVPPQQRAMMEKMMKKQMGNMMPKSIPTAESKLSKRGQSKTVAGYKTTHVQQKRDGQLTSEYWAVGWDKIEGGDEVQEAFLGMAKFQDNLTKAFTQGGSNPMMGMVKSMSDNMFKQMSKMNGFPVSVINYKDGTKSRESVLESIDIRTLDPEAFEPPNGYKRQRMGGR